MPAVAPPRRLVVVRGSPEETATAARALLDGFADVSFVDERSARTLLGQTRDAVVLSLHDGASADAIGAAHGVVRAGGALVLRLPADDRIPPRAALAVYPFGVDDVTARFAARLVERLARVVDTGPLSPPPPFTPRGNDEQARVTDALARAFLSEDPSIHVVLAHRGRGKSSALGLALRAARSVDVVVTGPDARAYAEVLSRAPHARPIEADTLLDGDAHASPQVLVVDEAAQLPIPTLRALVRRFPRARIAFATTTHGYEGTGRGFALRFLAWLREQPRPVSVHTLTAPIRFAEDDPLERAIFDALLLDPVVIDDEKSVTNRGARAPRLPQGLVTEHIDRDALVKDEELLARIFGLFTHAHHRTTPGDLERLLDAPNLSVHVARRGHDVLGACIVAREGGFTVEESHALARGAHRVRGHALADTLLTHAARVEAGPLPMARSVRIVTDPQARRAGVARALVDHVHARFDDAELFGTLFGAARDLVLFRIAQGYTPVRIGVVSGARSGAPAIVMTRAASARARALVEGLALDLARDLPHLRTLTPVDPDVLEVVAQALPSASSLDDEGVRARVRRYVDGPQPFEGAAHAITVFVEQRRSHLSLLDADARSVVVGRVLERRSWRHVGRSIGGTPRAMRLLRPAIARLLESVP